MSSVTLPSVRRWLLVLLVTLLALAPVLYVFARTEAARRNIVYWDEFDTALALLLRLDEGTTPTKFFREMFAINNEHRMVTSRLLFATSYALTGTVNFVFVNLVGNATLLAFCALLIATACTFARRITMTLILAALLFQLQHYENLMWSGASIDHFQVVLLAAATIVLVAKDTRGGIIAGSAFAALATFTLAHGILTWLIGALMLLRTGNRRGLLLWSVIGAIVIAGFLYGFQLNRSQGFATLSLSGLLLVLRYWLTLLGALPALGHLALAPWLGALLLAVIFWLARRQTLRREPIAFPLMLFAVLALALIAVGRAQHSGGVVFSRYYVLGGVAWGMMLFMLLTRVSHPRRPLVPVMWALPALAVFNIAANRTFALHADSWVECRDRAAVRYLQHGVDGKGPLFLHPAPLHSTALLHAAERKGLYRMPPVCEPEPFPRKTKSSARLAYFVDDMTVDQRAVYVTGWAALQGVQSQRDRVHLVLRSSNETRVYTTITETRPDVAKATQQPGWELSGFQFVALRTQLPEGEFQLGFLIEGPDGPEYTMTAHRVNLIGEGKALLASGD